MSKKQSKCDVRDGKFVDPCWMLSEATEYGNPRGKKKGIWFWELHSVNGGMTRRFFGAKSGEHTAKGLVFNFCPYCGTDISAPFSGGDEQ